jgi:hypothetical protein
VQQRARRARNRLPEHELARENAAYPEADCMQGVRKKQRDYRERQLEREPNEERGLEHKVGWNSPRSDQTLEVLLDGEADRRQERKKAQRRRRRPTASEALTDPEHQPCQDEGERPDDDRRGVSEVRVAALGVKPHVVLRAGRDEPVGEAVRAKPGRDRQR